MQYIHYCLCLLIYIHLYMTYIQTCRSLPFMLFVDVFIHAWVQIGINPTC